MLVEDNNNTGEVYAAEAADFALRMSQSTILTKVLGGCYPEWSVIKMSHARLESLVSRLVICTAGVDYKADGDNQVRWMRPKWWPKDVAFGQSISALRGKVPNSAKWAAMLRELVSKCSQFYKDAPFATLKSDDAIYYCGGLGNREDYENVAQTGLKRKAVDDRVWPDPKRRRLEKKPDDKKVLSEKTTSNVTPVVKLCDIQQTSDESKTAPKPETKDKDAFMSYFGLWGNNNTPADPTPAPKPHNPIRLYQVPHIPLSSEIGQLLTKRDVPQPMHHELQLRRLERVEWHLKTDPLHFQRVAKAPDYEVTYDERKKPKHAHGYKFPRRQQHQRRPTFHELLLRLCSRRRLYVKLTRDDLLELKRRLIVKKRLSVQMVNMDLTPYPHHDFSEERQDAAEEEEKVEVIEIPDDDGNDNCNNDPAMFVEEDCVLITSNPTTPLLHDPTLEDVIVID